MTIDQEVELLKKIVRAHHEAIARIELRVAADGFKEAWEKANCLILEFDADDEDQKR